MTKPSTNPKQRQRDNDEFKESPSCIRNGKDLIEKAVDALDSDRCRTAIIQPQRQFFYLDCQSRAWRDISWHVVLCKLQPGNSDRWLSKSTVDHLGRVDFSACGPPAPVSTGRFIISPRLVRIWADTSALEQEGKQGDPKLCHCLVVRGASASAVQKFTIYSTVTGALNSAFHALANGFEVAFAASFLAEENETFTKASVESCTTVLGLNEVKAAKDVENVGKKHFQHGFVRRAGIIY